MAQIVSLKTPLYQAHIDVNAKLIDFHGWQLPIHYGSQLDEHHSVRQSAGVFDVSHMTVIDIVGEHAQSWLRSILTNDVAKLDTTEALYSCLCNAQGGVLDDLIVYKLSDSRFRLIVNAGTRDKDIQWLQQHLRANVQLELPEDIAMLAIQGPYAEAKLETALKTTAIDMDVRSLKRFGAIEHAGWFVGRTGYTGEDGFEVILPAEHAPLFFSTLLDQGVRACGLGARDTLRLEAGMCLYGQDLSEQHTPIESGIGFSVDVSDPKRDFIGRDILQEQKNAGSAVQQVALVLQQRGIMRAGHTVQHAGESVGVITSGSFSPTLQRSIALARVKSPVSERFDVLIRNKPMAATISALPFTKNL